jgi:hypothetical protein
MMVGGASMTILVAFIMTGIIPVLVRATIPDP